MKRGTDSTVLELLIALGAFGLLAVAVVPSLRLPGALAYVDDATRQKRTVDDMRGTGRALFSWLTDEIGAAAAGRIERRVDLGDYPPILPGDLTTILVPHYLKKLPTLDGWSHSYEYFLNVRNPLAQQVAAIRSSGRNRWVDGNVYIVEPFDADDYDQDIVWADGFFVRWPERRTP